VATNHSNHDFEENVIKCAHRAPASYGFVDIHNNTMTASITNLWFLVESGNIPTNNLFDTCERIFFQNCPKQIQLSLQPCFATYRRNDIKVVQRGLPVIYCSQW